MIHELVRILEEPFDPGAAIQHRIEGVPNVGGLASFTGYVRSDGGVEALELSHYEPLTRSGMDDIASQATVRFDLLSITLLHRVGMMRPGEPIVLVAAAARHRRDAINAVDYCMDHLKCAAWFWKRECIAGQWRWIEPRPEDHADLARWQN